MATSLTFIIVGRGDSEEDSLTPNPLIDDLVEMNKNEMRGVPPPSIENYHVVKDKLDKSIYEEQRKIGLVESEKRIEKERKEKERKEKERKRKEEIRLAEQKRAEEEKLIQLAKEEEKRKEDEQWQTYEITQYTAGYESTQKRKGEQGYGVTASGDYVQEGTTIACPEDIPFGTKIYIEVMDHTYICTDRGSKVTSGKLDVYVNDLNKALNFGRQQSRIKFVN